LFANKCKSCPENEYEKFSDCIVKLEQPYGKYKLDCAVFENDQLICVIEVYHTHLTDPEKIEYILNNGIGYYEISTIEVIKNGEPVNFEKDIVLNNINNFKQLQCKNCIEKAKQPKPKIYRIEKAKQPKPKVYRNYIESFCKSCKNIFIIEKTSEKYFSIRLCSECQNKQ
jgi:hypothetical protein